MYCAVCSVCVTCFHSLGRIDSHTPITSSALYRAQPRFVKRPTYIYIDREANTTNALQYATFVFCCKLVLYDGGMHGIQMAVAIIQISCQWFRSVAFFSRTMQLAMQRSVRQSAQRAKHFFSAAHNTSHKKLRCLGHDCDSLRNQACGVLRFPCVDCGWSGYHGRLQLIDCSYSQ